jgi:hypothetical protein
MPPASKRVALALDAIDAVLELLSRAPHSDERRRLSDEARWCERLVRGWELEAPTSEQREVVMKRILNLHIAAKLRAE